MHTDCSNLQPTPAQIAERRIACGLRKTEAGRIVTPHCKSKQQSCKAWDLYESGAKQMTSEMWDIFCYETTNLAWLNSGFKSPAVAEVAARRIACGLSKTDAGRIVAPRSTVPAVSWDLYESGKAVMPVGKWRSFTFKTEKLYQLYSQFQPPIAAEIAARRIASGLSKANAGRIISPDATNPCSVWCAYESGRGRISSQRWKLFYLKTEEIFRGLSQKEQVAFTKTETHLLQPEYA